jgi:hypothetical protein
MSFVAFANFIYIRRRWIKFIMGITIINKGNLTQKKLEGYLKYNEILVWGRRNPVKFAELILGLELMDYQKYTFQESWTKQFALWLMSRNGG